MSNNKRLLCHKTQEPLPPLRRDAAALSNGSSARGVGRYAPMPRGEKMRYMIATTAAPAIAQTLPFFHGGHIHDLGIRHLPRKLTRADLDADRIDDALEDEQCEYNVQIVEPAEERDDLGQTVQHDVDRNNNLWGDGRLPFCSADRTGQQSAAAWRRSPSTR